ncbi:hypothetical protein [Ferrimonas kyonanensis]|uniref:hypothetical protein n=1 Tax=Ferrimonas kyonanensis TaxID=364763 RepID=UPI0005574744|nr:hypothetical protein [Ferrimonas kyonanensis]
MSNLVSGDTVTVAVLGEIASRFEYADSDHKKAAIDKMNNAIYAETDLDELEAIAKSYSVDGD